MIQTRSSHRGRALVWSTSALGLLLAACGSDDSPTASAADEAAPTTTVDLMLVDDEGVTSVSEEALTEALAEPTEASLSAEEAAGLAFMREEEKLAQEVYAVLYTQWQLSIFDNISGSEATHTEAVRALLERYGLTDPAQGAELGVFANADLQALYDALFVRGAVSLEEALRVGVAIEEIDILDLEEWLGQTSNADIVLVYGNLLKGSRNHLRSFTSNLESRTGVTYEPEYLSADQYEAIVSTPMERGRNG